MIEIYADVVFFINWIMDLFIFWITALLAKRKLKAWRVITGAGISAFLYCVLVFMPVISKYYNFYSSLIVLLSGLVVAFGITGLKDFFKLAILAHISAFAVGGVGSALFYYSNIGHVVGNAIGFTMNYFSIKTLIAAVCISYIIIKSAVVFIGNISLKKQAVYNIRIFFGDSSVEIPMLVDTGNTLLEPVSKWPVIIAEFEYVKDFLPPKLTELFALGQENDLSMIISAVSGETMEKHIRMIPFKSLGNENGMLVGFKPFMVELLRDGEIMSVTDVVVGVYNLSLTKGGEYHGLLNPQVLEAGHKSTNYI